MDRYIGIDVRAASCTIVVVHARGKQVVSHVHRGQMSALVDELGDYATGNPETMIFRNSGTGSA